MGEIAGSIGSVLRSQAAKQGGSRFWLPFCLCFREGCGCLSVCGMLWCIYLVCLLARLTAFCLTVCCPFVYLFFMSSAFFFFGFLVFSTVGDISGQASVH